MLKTNDPYLRPLDNFSYLEHESLLYSHTDMYRNKISCCVVGLFFGYMFVVLSLNDRFYRDYILEIDRSGHMLR